MASNSIETLTPDTRDRAQAFLRAAKAHGFELTVASTLRSCADQGMSTAPIIVQGMAIKRAAGCRSWHVWGRAFDVLLKDPSPQRYEELGKLGEDLGLVWGGRFVANPDPIHFEYHPGLDIMKMCPDPSRCDDALLGAWLPISVSTTKMPKATEDGWTRAIFFGSGAFFAWLFVSKSKH